MPPEALKSRPHRMPFSYKFIAGIKRLQLQLLLHSKLRYSISLGHMWCY